jgi:hypothetical protein
MIDAAANSPGRGARHPLSHGHQRQAAAEGAAVVYATGAPAAPDVLVRVEHLARAFSATQVLKD